MVEKIMFNFEDYLYDLVPKMLIHVNNDRFEEAIIIRNQIRKKINQIYQLLLNNSYSLMESADLSDELYILYYAYINEWNDILNIPMAQRIL